MKKVLIITYYWPPAGGPGVQRVLKFVKYLPEYGWEPVVLTVEKGEYPAIDYSLVKEIPPGVKVIKTKTNEPYGLFRRFSGHKGHIPTHILNENRQDKLIVKVSRWIRANLFVPDGRIGWVRHMVKSGLEVVRTEEPSVIFSSSPPHSVQLGALKLARITGLPWIADFRDPWTDGFWLKDLPRMKWAWEKDRKLERSVLKGADKVITRNEIDSRMFSGKVENSYVAIPNGYDPLDFEGVEAQGTDKFIILHSGSMRKSQLPHLFLQSLGQLIKQGAVDQLELHFVGTVHPFVREAVVQYGVESRTRFHGYVDHSVLIPKMVDAQLLLLPIPDTEDNEGILPGKLFEYMGSGRTTLGIGPSRGEAAHILETCKCGFMYEYDQDPGDFILQKYKEWEMYGTITVDGDPTPYTRRKLTGKLAAVFNEVVGK